MYWLGVYLLVVVGVAIPFLLLYLVGVFFWLALGAIRLVMRKLNDTLTARPDLSRAQWTGIRQKAA